MLELEEQLFIPLEVKNDAPNFVCTTHLGGATMIHTPYQIIQESCTSRDPLYRRVYRAMEALDQSKLPAPNLPLLEKLYDAIHAIQSLESIQESWCTK